MSALSFVYILQQLSSFFRLDALLEDSRHAVLVQLAVDYGVRLRTALE
jgi:hypothetical protein